MFGISNFDFPKYRSECNSVASFSSDGGSKKRRGSFIDSNDDDGDNIKIPRTAGDWNKRQNHSEIEKRRRDKMNTYIMELSSIIPVCTSRKLDKLTVLRMAVQHMKMLRGSLNSYTEGHYKPAFLSDDELKNLILQAADGFLFVVGCDRGRILYVSESVYQTLHYTQGELLGMSWFDILHPKDLTKVKEQLSCSDISRRERLVDAKTLLPVKADVPQGLNKLCPGSRRAFFCRMRCKSAPVLKEEADSSTGCQKKKSKSQSSDKKYSVIHFTGYLKSWAPTKDSLEEDSGSDSESCNLSCLVAVGRVHQPLLASSVRETSRLGRAAPVQRIEFISKHTNDGKFVFIDQRASLLLGWLPQELLGSSMYEYFHQDDITFLTETHRATLQNSESCTTQVYRFRTKEGYFVRLQSNWWTFKNPWTKEIEYIISKNSVVTRCMQSTHFAKCNEDFYYAGGDIVLEWLVQLFNKCMEEGKVPRDWQRACIVPLYKGKGDKRECKNYRGISLLSVPGKVYGRVIIERIKSKTEKRIADEQGGFRKGRGCVDQVFTVKHISEQYLDKAKEVFVAFMDLEKAYDRVDRGQCGRCCKCMV
nr:protein cycle-like isoform X4 [Cherax quadricarinatus]